MLQNIQRDKCLHFDRLLYFSGYFHWQNLRNVYYNLIIQAMNNFHFSVVCLVSHISQVGHQTRKSYVHVGVKVPLLLLYTVAMPIDFNENENGMEQDSCSMFWR